MRKFKLELNLLMILKNFSDMKYNFIFDSDTKDQPETQDKPVDAISEKEEDETIHSVEKAEIHSEKTGI